MNRIRWYGPSLLLLVAVVVTLLAGPGLMDKMASAQTQAHIRTTRAQMAENPFLAQMSQAFRQVADVVEPSVVSIEVRRRQPQGRGMNDLEDMLRRRFGPQMPEGPWGQSPFGERSPREGDEYERYNVPQPFGAGSGWVYDEQGHIVTNNHVVHNADEVVVRFADGSRYDAEVIGTDPSTDVAVLKIEDDTLTPAARAEEAVEQGDMVFAFGSPFQFEFSMSQGIVSATGRKRLGILGRGGYENFIQTDAAINPGNSGGPLTDIYGQVVGMNTAIASQTGAFNGLGFAIPVNMVENVVDQIVETGAVSRGFIGVGIQTLDPTMAATYDFEGQGVLVTSIVEGSPAAESELQTGDIITEVDGEPVETADDLRFRIARMEPGTQIEVTVVRNGETEAVDLTLGTMPGQQTRMQPGDEDEDEAGDGGRQLLRKLGLTGVSPFSEEMARRLDVSMIEGVLVESVRRQSIAAAAGLSRGTIITRVMGEPVADVGELVDVLQQHSDRQAVRMRVAQWNPQDREFVQRFVAMEIPQD
ncbi:MAG: trypsin-like peptidase domain-containing protein [Phycisphaeraceae bacterium]